MQHEVAMVRNTLFMAALWNRP